VGRGGAGWRDTVTCVLVEDFARDMMASLFMRNMVRATRKMVEEPWMKKASQIRKAVCVGSTVHIMHMNHSKKKGAVGKWVYVGDVSVSVCARARVCVCKKIVTCKGEPFPHLLILHPLSPLTHSDHLEVNAAALVGGSNVREEHTHQVSQHPLIRLHPQQCV